MSCAVSLKAYGRDAPFKDIYETYQKDGAVIVHNLLSKEEIQCFRDEVRGTLKTTDAGARNSHVHVNEDQQKFWGNNTIRFSQMATRSKTFLNKYLVHPLLIQMADAELVSNEYWLNTGQVMCIGPNSEAQELHRDAEHWPSMCKSREDEAIQISFMLAVDDYTKETGATCVVPGSHNWDDYSRTPESYEVVQAAMPAGSVLIYSGKVIHGGGPNSTHDRWREGCHLSFLSRWLVPEEAACLSITKEDALKLTPLQQSLLGWKSYTEGEHELWTLDLDDPLVALGCDTKIMSLQDKFYEKYATDEEWVDGFVFADCASVYVSGMDSLDEYFDMELDYKQRKSLRRKLKKACFKQTKGFEDEDVPAVKDLLTAHWEHYGDWDGSENYCMAMFEEMKENVIVIRDEKGGKPVGIIQYCHGNVKLANVEQLHHFVGLWAVQKPRSGVWHTMMTALIEKAIELKCDVVSMGNNMHEQKRRNFGAVNFEINYQRLTSEPLPLAAGASGGETPSVLDLWDDTYWDDLPSELMAAVVDLGYTKDMWDNDEPSPWDDEDWCDLPEHVKKAAKKIGYSAKTWNEGE
eukprot:scaffold2322_cov136-Skeletonema_dohrnii-CCMP3373.AAC.2